ncbi:hypothetical protein D7X74_37830 [Corallococcus sp. CA047B]|uniref:hypothetical protein n=1 Tax=Corallococcus sp. CA047B TaxID=2316729 RepID=UPI000EA0F106|nr:hypothetical protein [Corallococcus sp. CA047B]RKH01483.1 hypothetical protein D7X74_37830 [Corallococcus sp. CA047B]
MHDAFLVAAAVALFLAAYWARATVWWWPLAASYCHCVVLFWWRVYRHRPLPESTPAAPYLRLAVDNTRRSFKHRTGGVL